MGVRSLLGKGKGFLAIIAFHVGLPLRNGTSSGVASVKSNLKLTLPLANLWTHCRSGLYRRLQRLPKAKAPKMHGKNQIGVVISNVSKLISHGHVDDAECWPHAQVFPPFHQQRSCTVHVHVPKAMDLWNTQQGKAISKRRVAEAGITISCDLPESTGEVANHNIEVQVSVVSNATRGVAEASEDAGFISYCVRFNPTHATDYKHD